MAQHKCTICNGSGVVEVNSRLTECRCSFVRRLIHSMPVYIRKTTVMKEHLALPILKDWRKCYFVTSSWADMRALIKAWIITNASKHLMVTSDREIKEVFVGNKARTDGEVEYLTARFNSIEELVDPADLLVIKLNELGYKNKAAAGALEEAINYRLDRDKITWVFNDVRRPFGNSSFCYSDSLADILGSGFRSVVIQPILKEADIQTTLLNTISPVKVAVNNAISEIEKEQKPTVKPKPHKPIAIKPNYEDTVIVPEAVEEPDLASIYGSGIKKKKGR